MDFDWNLLRSFLSVVDEGSLSAAARTSHISQPTLGRHIDELERSLATTLFDRTGRSLEPTQAALQLAEKVRAAETILNQAQHDVTEQEQEIRGTVRLTASNIVSHYILPDILRKLRDVAPEISIELVSSDSTQNLLEREADIALRMFRPTQNDLITKKIGNVATVTCAHQSYLDRYGTPHKPQDLFGHTMLGLDHDRDIIEGAKQIGWKLAREDFAFRCDNHSVVWEMTKAGLGISFAQKLMVRDTPGMQAILPDLPVPGMELWLTTHRALRTNARIRKVFDILSVLCKDYLDSTGEADDDADEISTPV